MEKRKKYSPQYNMVLRSLVSECWQYFLCWNGYNFITCTHIQKQSHFSTSCFSGLSTHLSLSIWPTSIKVRLYNQWISKHLHSILILKGLLQCGPADCIHISTSTTVQPMHWVRFWSTSSCSSVSGMGPSEDSLKNCIPNLKFLKLM